MKTCNECKIQYEEQESIFDPEMPPLPCPLCEANKKNGRLNGIVKTLKNKLSQYETCEECQNTYGYCDKERKHCDKLSKFFSQ